MPLNTITMAPSMSTSTSSPTPLLQQPQPQPQPFRRSRQQQELLAIVSLHREALSFLEKGHLEASRDCFQSTFSSITRLLRETPNRDAFYFRGSPLVRESSFSPSYLEDSSASTFSASAFTSTSSSESSAPLIDDDDDANNSNTEDECGGGSKDSSSSSSNTNTNTASDHVSSHPHSELAPPSVAAISTEAASVSVSVSCSDEDLPLYHRALHLPKLVTINQFVFVTLYNLALSTHLSALSPPPQQQGRSHCQDQPPSVDMDASMMRRAAKQWGLVYALQWRQGLNLRPAHGLAILLNLGHAKSVTGNDSGSKICYQNILSAIQILDSRNHEIPHKAFFLYNAFRMLGGGPGAARHGVVMTASAA